MWGGNSVLVILGFRDLGAEQPHYAWGGVFFGALVLIITFKGSQIPPLDLPFGRKFLAHFWALILLITFRVPKIPPPLHSGCSAPPAKFYPHGFYAPPHTFLFRSVLVDLGFANQTIFHELLTGFPLALSLAEESPCHSMHPRQQPQTPMHAMALWQCIPPPPPRFRSDPVLVIPDFGIW